MQNILFGMLLALEMVTLPACSVASKQTHSKDEQKVTEAGNPDDDMNPTKGGVRGVLVAHDAATMNLEGDAASVPATSHLVVKTFSSKGIASEGGPVLGQGAYAVAIAGDLVYYARENADGSSDVVLFDPAKPEGQRDTKIDYTQCAPDSEILPPSQLA